MYLFGGPWWLKSHDFPFSGSTAALLALPTPLQWRHQSHELPCNASPAFLGPSAPKWPNVSLRRLKVGVCSLYTKYLCLKDLQRYRSQDESSKKNYALYFSCYFVTALEEGSLLSQTRQCCNFFTPELMDLIHPSITPQLLLQRSVGLLSPLQATAPSSFPPAKRSTGDGKPSCH